MLHFSLEPAQRITAHLVQGLQLSAEASLSRRNDDAQATTKESALAEFDKALLLKSDDLDALQMAAREAKLLNDESAALAYLGRMAEAAEAQNDVIRHARALRFQGEILEGRGEAGWDQARPVLVSARDLLIESSTRHPAKPKELALVRELLGSVQINREKFRAAKQELDRAKIDYSNISEPLGSEGVKRVDELLKKITQREDEPDKPGQTAEVIPTVPTHVNHACPLSYGAIASYMSANKELGHDANDTGRSVA